MKKKLINRNDHVIKLFKCNMFVNFFSVRDLGPISSTVDIGFSTHQQNFLVEIKNH